MPAPSTARRRTWFVVIAAAIALVVAVVALALPRLAGPPAAPVADRFTAPATWEQVTDVVTAPSLLCLGGQPCPSVHRGWNTTSLVTPDDLAALTDAAGWDTTVTGTCTPEQPTERTVCRATGTADGFAVELLVAAGTDTDGASVQLHVRPN